MVTVKTIAEIMESFAPTSRAMGWDNVGLIIGRADANVTKVLVALDATAAVIAEAEALGAELIVTHHPVIFKGISQITDGTWQGRNLLRLIENNIAVYTAHTNLDTAAGGTNDALCARLKLADVQPLIYDEGECAIGRRGFLPEAMTLGAFAAFVKEALGLDAVQFCGEAEALVRTAAVCAGSGGKYAYLRQVKAVGCDVYVTADISFHEAQDALADGLSLVDATHYAGEVLVVERLQLLLGEALAKEDVSVVASAVNGQVFQSV